MIGIDVQTGEQLSEIDGAPGTITGLAVDGAVLYTMDTANTLRAISLVGTTPALIGALVLPGGGNGLVVGDGIATVAAGDVSGNGGYVTVDVSDPTKPKLLAGDTVRGSAGNALALNGSGLGLFAGNIALFAQGLVPELDVINTSDPGNTANRVGRFLLPATPGGVAISGGLGYVADGTAGLQVVRYQAFVPNTVAPTITVTTAPGATATEGADAAIGVQIATPGQILSTEVLLNGVSVLTDLKYPFDLSVALPTIAANGGTAVTLAVRATDTNGNVTTTAPIAVTLVPDVAPPALVSATVSNGAVISTDTHTLRFTFNKPLQAGAASGAAFVLTDGPGAVIAPTTIALTADGRTVQAT